MKPNKSSYQVHLKTHKSIQNKIPHLWPDSILSSLKTKSPPFKVSSVLEGDQDGQLRPTRLHHWKELLDGSGFFVCLSSLKSKSPLTVSLGLSTYCVSWSYGAVCTTSAIAWKSIFSMGWHFSLQASL